MREIKFRVWDLSVSKYRTFLTLSANTGAICSSNPDHYVLEQFTGLHDKNGKEIYEGDRVLVLYTDWPSKTDETKTLDEYLDSISHVGIIEYSNEYGNAGFRALFDNDSVGMLNVGAHGRITVIGNIHENTEIING